MYLPSLEFPLDLKGLTACEIYVLHENHIYLLNCRYRAMELKRFRTHARDSGTCMN